MANSNQSKTPLSEYLAWAAAGIFFFYQYILRVSPGVMIDDLRAEFSLTADQFSTLGSYYLYAYALLQIPFGIILDKVGVRKTILASISLCIGGGFLLGYAQTLEIAQLSRILVGMGSATAFMGSLKIIADRLPNSQRGIFMGATLSLGVVGALTAGKPLVWMLNFLGWRETAMISASLGIPVLIFAFFTLPKRSAHATPTQNTHLFKRLLSIFKNPQIMLYALLAIGLYTPLSALADLWGPKFIMKKFDLERGDAALLNMTLYVGLAAGSLIIPWICERAHFLNRAIRVCLLALTAVFAYLLYGPVISEGPLFAVLVVVGLLCGAEMLCFSGAVLFSTSENSGMTIGVVNTFNMLGGAILQKAIGFSLDLQWDGAVDENQLRIYSLDQFINALSVLLIVIAICFLASFFLKFRGHQEKTG